jgi:hypothetical protein
MIPLYVNSRSVVIVNTISRAKLAAIAATKIVYAVKPHAGIVAMNSHADALTRRKSLTAYYPLTLLIHALSKQQALREIPLTTITSLKRKKRDHRSMKSAIQTQSH